MNYTLHNTGYLHLFFSTSQGFVTTHLSPYACLRSHSILLSVSAIASFYAALSLCLFLLHTHSLSASIYLPLSLSIYFSFSLSIAHRLLLSLTHSVSALSLNVHYHICRVLWTLWFHMSHVHLQSVVDVMVCHVACISGCPSNCVACSWNSANSRHDCTDCADPYALETIPGEEHVCVSKYDCTLELCLSNRFIQCIML